MQIRKGQRSKERMGGGREGGREGAGIRPSHRYGDGAVHSAPTILSYCRANPRYMQREHEEVKKKEERGVMVQKAQINDQNRVQITRLPKQISTYLCHVINITYGRSHIIL